MDAGTLIAVLAATPPIIAAVTRLLAELRKWRRSRQHGLNFNMLNAKD